MDHRKIVRGGQELTMNTAAISAYRGQRSKNTKLPTASVSRTPDDSWLSTWEEHKRKHPDLVLFPRVGRSHTLWIALDEDAQRVGRILGVEPRQFPYAEGRKTAIKLWVPEPHPAWFDGLYQALEGNVLAYNEADPELKSIADTLIPPALIPEREPVLGDVSRTAAPESSATNSSRRAALVGTNGPPAYIASSADNGGRAA